MSTKATNENIQLEPITKAMVDDRVLSHYVAPEGSCSYIENLHNDELGFLTSRRSFMVGGLGAITIPNYITSYNSTSGGLYLVFQDGGNLKYISTTSFWGGPTKVTIGSLVGTSSNDTMIDTIQGYMIVVNKGQPMKYADVSGVYTNLGTSFTNTLNIVSAGFGGRIWGADNTDATCKLYYSDVIPAAGVTSTTGGAEYLRLNSNSGDRINGLIRTQNILYALTTNQVFRIFGTTSQDTSPIANIGAVSKKGIVSAKDGYYFIHYTGIYRLSEGGRPEEISQKIRPLIERISNQTMQSAVGWTDNDHIYFSVGKTVSGLPNDRNYIIVYTISTGNFSIVTTFDRQILAATSSFPGYNNEDLSVRDYSPSVFITYSTLDSSSSGIANIDSVSYNTAESNVGGDFTSAESPSSKSGIPIIVKYITQWKTLGAEHLIKEISGLSIPANKASGLSLYYQTDSMKESDWELVGTIGEDYITTWRNAKIPSFNKVRFMVSGDTLGGECKIGQPIIHKVIEKGY